MREDFENWLSKVYVKLDYPTRNAITLLRYKLKYQEKLTIVEVFLLIELVKLSLYTYGQVKTTK